MILAETSLSALETMINRYLSLDPEAVVNLSLIEGKVIAVEIIGINKTLYFFPHTDGMDVSDEFDGEVDTTLKGSPVALLKMGLSKDVAAMMLKGEVEIEGDVRLGRGFKKILSEMDIDWEEYIARVVGDAPAHHMANLTKKIFSWGKQASDDVIADVSEYLQEESRDVVSKAELEIFYQDVDDLRNKIDRFQARLNALKTNNN